jgi:hypothetical protein
MDKSMPLNDWGEVSTSNYLKGSDVPQPFVATIKDVRTVKLGTGNEMQIKAVVEFDCCKPMIFNKTNQNILCALYPEVTKRPLNAVGKQVEIYYDTTIQMHGQTVGGLRIRKPQDSAAARDSEVEKLKRQLAEMIAEKAAEKAQMKEFERAQEEMMLNQETPF